MSDTRQLYEQYADKLRRIADVKYASAVLQWDQETYLPEKGTAARSRQLATLNEMAHQLFTDKAMGDVLQELNQRSDLSFKQKKNVALTLEEFEKQQKFSSEFVRKMSELVSSAFYAWIDARRKNDFKVYEPALSVLIELKKQEAGILGYTSHPYNALLDQFEKGSTVELLDIVFEKVLDPLRQLMAEIVLKPQPGKDFFHQQGQP